jgi:hypothetical protein
MIPGSNLLKTALRVIARQTVSYFEVLEVTKNAAGYKVTSYDDAKCLTGSFQPIDSRYYSQMGLDFTKSYAMWYDPNGTVRDVQRDKTGDKIVFCGSTYVALSNNEWKPVDGWNSTLFVKVPS